MNPAAAVMNPAAAVSLSTIPASAITPDSETQELRRLADHVGLQRHIRRGRIICLKAAYSGIRRADELIADTALLDGATMVLNVLAAERAHLASLDQLAGFAGLLGGEP
jgi:hypothetical protein